MVLSEGFIVGMFRGRFGHHWLTDSVIIGNHMFVPLQ
jgi:hypothetical protein